MSHCTSRNLTKDEITARSFWGLWCGSALAYCKIALLLLFVGVGEELKECVIIV